MIDKDIVRFKPGRKFTSVLNGHDWRIDRVDTIDDILYVVDDFGYSCKMSVQDFDNLFYFTDELLPSGVSTVEEEAKCDCGGFKTYGSMASEYHSTSLPCSSLNLTKKESK